MSLLQIYWRALGYLASDRKRVAFICAANVTLAIITILEPILFGRVIDAMSDKQDVVPTLVLWAGLGAFNIIAFVWVARGADRFAHALYGAHLAPQPAVDKFFRAVDHRDLEGDTRLFLDRNQYVLEGQAGIGIGNFLGRNLIASGGDEFGLDAGGDDFGIDEYAVAIENDEVGFCHGHPELGGKERPRVRGMRGGIHQRAGGGKFRRHFMNSLPRKVTITAGKQ